jgi:MFS family permease
MTTTPVEPTRAAGAILLTLAAGQFVMTLDSSVMNVSIVAVAEDIDTTVVGIQTAITLYTLVMACLMITGGKVGQILGRKRAFMIGAAIYAAGSFTTAISQNLAMLIFGWSFLEGVGAALILPAIVALVASNFSQTARPRAYGLVAAAAAIAVAAGPLIGGFFTTYFSWRWVFVGEVLAIAVIVVVARKMTAAPPDPDVRLELAGTALSAAGLGLFVYGILRAGTWGFFEPKPDAPELFGVSWSFWLVLIGLVVLRFFLDWERRVIARGDEPLVDPELLRVPVLRAGLVAFFFQFLIQMGLFFLISLFLLVALGLSAIGAGLQLMPLSVALLAAAVGIPKLVPNASPRRVARRGFAAIVAGLVLLIALLDVDSGPEVVTWPLLLIGLGIGALASQLGSVTVSAVPDERSGEVGGLQNTLTNLGASIGTALAGAVLVSALTSSFFSGLDDNPDVPDAVVDQAEVELAAGVPFVSDDDLEDALDDAGVPPEVEDEIVDENTAARIEALQAALGVLALLGVIALLTSGRIPDEQPAAQVASGAAP